MSGGRLRGARLPWGIASISVVGCLGLGYALADAQDEVTSLEAQLLVTQRDAAAAAEAPRARRRGGRLAPWGKRSGAGRGGTEREHGGPGDDEDAGQLADAELADEDAMAAAERSDAGAGTRAERALADLESAIKELDLEPELADEVRVIYEDAFEDGARIRDELRDGERDEDSAREAHQAAREAAREQLEALLEPDELKHIRRRLRRGGRGRL